MFKLYLKDRDVPEYLLEVKGQFAPAVKFGGISLCWKNKGVIYLKPLTGEHAIIVSGGVDFFLSFKNVKVLSKLSLLNTLRSIFCRLWS